jgi:hypothetical protein
MRTLHLLGQYLGLFMLQNVDFVRQRQFLQKHFDKMSPSRCYTPVTNEINKFLIL